MTLPVQCKLDHTVITSHEMTDFRRAVLAFFMLFRRNFHSNVKEHDVISYYVSFCPIRVYVNHAVDTMLVICTGRGALPVTRTKEEAVGWLGDTAGLFGGALQCHPRQGLLSRPPKEGAQRRTMIRRS